jgi:hypothetical protein
LINEPQQYEIDTTIGNTPERKSYSSTMMTLVKEHCMSLIIIVLFVVLVLVLILMFYEFY